MGGDIRRRKGEGGRGSLLDEVAEFAGISVRTKSFGVEVLARDYLQICCCLIRICNERGTRKNRGGGYMELEEKREDERRRWDERGRREGGGGNHVRIDSLLWHSSCSCRICKFLLFWEELVNGQSYNLPIKELIES